jgi:hypothetical protein
MRNRRLGCRSRRHNASRTATPNCDVKGRDEMPIDQNSLGAHVAAQMEAIEADYADTDAQIGTIVTIVEVLSQERGSDVRVRPSDPRVHATLGILRWAETLTIASATQAGGGAE